MRERSGEDLCLEVASELPIGLAMLTFGRGFNSFIDGLELCRYFDARKTIRGRDVVVGCWYPIEKSDLKLRSLRTSFGAVHPTRPSNSVLAGLSHLGRR